MTLGQFETGWGWEAQVRQYVRKKYSHDLAGLAKLPAAALARLLGGEVLAGRPYASVQWVLRLKPFRPLELYLLFDQDVEFGADLRIFYARKSLAVPTEDAYVFAWNFVALLARYGRGTFNLQSAGPGPDWLNFSDFAARSAGPMKDVSLGAREELLPLLTPEVVEVAVRRLDSGTFAGIGGGWQVVWPILGDLAYRFQMSGGASEMAFDSVGARKYGPEFLTSFSWLYLNALLRECRQVDPALPQLSRYF
ncbi:MAG: hypothetical protein M1438_16325 [Deltaproteobacteria bacterium]|nr:hypothetical protein [Deltaproteobacteria bacterium]